MYLYMCVYVCVSVDIDVDISVCLCEHNYVISTYVSMTRYLSFFLEIINHTCYNHNAFKKMSVLIDNDGDSQEITVI